MRPPFRVEHVGSFLRPERLIQAARERKAGQDRRCRSEAPAGRMRARDRHLPGRDRTALDHRRRVPPAQLVGGLHRRGGGVWPAGRNIELSEMRLLLSGRVLPVRQGAAQAQAAHRRRRLQFSEVRGQKRGVPKVTMAARRHALLPRAEGVRYLGVSRPRGVLRSADADLPRRDRRAAAEGCTYLQLDDTALPCNCDAHAREDVKARGEDPDELTERYSPALSMNASPEAQRHDGGDSPLPRQPEGRLDGRRRLRADRRGAVQPARCGIYCLEYDTERAGDFAPLRFVPKGKRVILGLVSTKTPVLEGKRI